VERSTWPRRAATCFAVLSAMAATACTAAIGGQPAPVPTTIVSSAWIDRAAAAWPESDGHAAGVMFSSNDTDCTLDGGDITVLGVDATWLDVGYGPDPTGEDIGAFVHRCGLWDRDTHRFAGSVELHRFTNLDVMRDFVAEFSLQGDTAVQDNEVAAVQSGRYPMQTLRRWYPTNPQGMYQALVEDRPQGVVIVLEVNSLSGADFRATSAQQVADVLAAFLDEGHRNSD